MALILPKGIVVNSPEIEATIQSYVDEPVDSEHVAHMWKVFTTTSRRLRDPTAERLENYWWRIWGSRRRELNGATVANLFALISDGESFVPLYSPVPRDETGGNPILSNNARQAHGGSNSTIVQLPRSTPKSPVDMPPPILKNTQGKKKSHDGPRPTARFVSPQESPSSSVRPHVVVQPPSPDSAKGDKKGSSSSSSRKGQGHVVAGSRKKRPVIVRRKGSQSSGDATDTKLQKSKFKENFSPELESVRVASQEKLLARNATQEQASASGDPGPSSKSGPVARYEDELTAKEVEEPEIQRMILTEANSSKKKQDIRQGGIESQHLHPEDSQNQESQRSEETIINAYRPDHLRNEGMYIGGDSTSETDSPSPTKLDKGKGKSKMVEDSPPSPSNGMFAKRPVQPITGTSAIAASLPGSLARSKSQLTLLLEKDRSGSGKEGGRK